MSPLHSAPSGLTTSDRFLRTQYLTEMLRLLYPERTDAPQTEFILVPGSRRPRLLAPAGSRRMVAAAVRQYTEPQGRLDRLKRSALVAAIRRGPSNLVLPDRILVASTTDTIETFLRGVLHSPVSVSVHIGPARANRKPVLQLLRPDATTLGFAKIGVNPLTRQLVRSEAAALDILTRASLRTVRVPGLLYAGQWHDHQVLVQSALPIWRHRTRLSQRQITDAMREVAAVDGTYSAVLRTSRYWDSLRDRLRAIESQEDGRSLSHAAHTLVDQSGDTTLRFGSWHGDWSPWNMAGRDGELLLWDWERFARDVPFGFDAVHLFLQRALQSRGFRAHSDASQAVEVTIHEAPRTLAGFDVTDPAIARMTALLYLIDLATRYLTDRQAEAGARLGVLGSWLLPVLLAQVTTVPAGMVPTTVSATVSATALVGGQR